jgi:hypothetical protein
MFAGRIRIGLALPEYARGNETFLRALQDLEDVVVRRDVEATALACVSMALTCVRCHQEVARARRARETPRTRVCVRP